MITEEKERAMRRLVDAFNDLVGLEVVNAEDRQEFLALLGHIDCHVYVCGMNRAEKVGWPCV